MNTLNFASSVFSATITVPKEAQVVFVADMFVDDYVGGAELTSEALIKSSPYAVFKLRSKDVTLDHLKENVDKFWIFGNFCSLDARLIPSIIANMRYSVVEYDYKFCRARSPEKHFDVTGTPCDCANQMNGKLVSAFYGGSMGLWWMSERQKERYMTAFPFLAGNKNVVLSSVFDETTLSTIANLHANAPVNRQKWIVLGSESWIKGATDAERWCKANGKDYEVIWNVPYAEVLEKMSRAEGFVYLPKGGDTCPRMVIEAKLLGCQLRINDNVQNHDESWFLSDDLQDIQDYLLAAPAVFWSGIKSMIEHRHTVSGYITTYNCVKQEYPFEQCIRSMLQFCDEVCVVDGGSTDTTFDRLVGLAYPGALDHGIESAKFIEDLRVMTYFDPGAELPDCFHLESVGQIKKDPRVRIKIVRRDWSSKRHPVFDGMQKAEARAMCTKEFCWQMDADEVVHENDAAKVAAMCSSFPKEADIIALPVIEYWGGPEKVRLDVQPWKWRLSRNLSKITHGIPLELRLTDPEGQLYAAEGTDGCDMVDRNTGLRIQHVSFYSPDVENVRRLAMSGDETARQQYEQWFNQVVNDLPCVFHYSWYDLERKVRLYRDYWQNHWNALWDKDTSDTAVNNLMFGIPWKDVTDMMISDRVTDMKEKLGGWIWHRAWDGSTRTPHVRCDRRQPAVMTSGH